MASRTNLPSGSATAIIEHLSDKYQLNSNVNYIGYEPTHDKAKAVMSWTDDDEVVIIEVRRIAGTRTV